jgi:hypothetical protein
MRALLSSVMAVITFRLQVACLGFFIHVKVEIVQGFCPQITNSTMASCTKQKKLATTNGGLTIEQMYR